MLPEQTDRQQAPSARWEGQRPGCEALVHHCPEPDFTWKVLGVTSLQTPRAQNREWAKLQSPRQCLAQRSCWRWACGVSKGLGSRAELGWRGGRTCHEPTATSPGSAVRITASVSDRPESPSRRSRVSSRRRCHPPSISFKRVPGGCVQKSLRGWACRGAQKLGRAPRRSRVGTCGG